LLLDLTLFNCFFSNNVLLQKEILLDQGSSAYIHKPPWQAIILLALLSGWKPIESAKESFRHLQRLSCGFSHLRLSILKAHRIAMGLFLSWIPAFAHRRHFKGVKKAVQATSYLL
jgi:hypothetical protein